MIDKLKAISDKYVHLEEQLSDPSVIGDKSDRFKDKIRRYTQFFVQIFSQTEIHFSFAIHHFWKRCFWDF